MTVALLSIGTELVRGEIANTNAAWLADQLTQLGFAVTTIETVADDREVLKATLQRLSHEHAFVIATGGLGPTSDDITAACAADFAGVPLQRNEDALAAIRRKLDQRGIPLRPSHEKQATLPQGAEVLTNATGTAPGFVVRHGQASFYFLPGVPREMRPMFADQLAPRIRVAAPNNSFQVRLRTYGLPESEIEERLGDLGDIGGITLGYMVHSGEVDVKVLAQGIDYAQARELAESTAHTVRERLGDAIYGEGEDTLPVVTARILRNRGWRLAVAESCTGGLIAQQLTQTPASDFFVGGAITYANTAKSALLGVSEDTLRWHGAVSAEVAAEMAEGARRAFHCDVALSVTGIAGPSGATADKPLGLCYWAVAHPDGTVIRSKVFSGERTVVQQKAANAVMDELRRAVVNGDGRHDPRIFGGGGDVGTAE